MTDQTVIDTVLRESNTIAIVGLSDKPNRASNRVAEYLMDNGFIVIPVNPRCEEILSQKCYAKLEDIPLPIDIVDCFRRTEEIPALARSAVAIGANCLWMQLDIVNHDAKKIAEKAGLLVVMNRCPKIEYARLVS